MRDPVSWVAVDDVVYGRIGVAKPQPGSWGGFAAYQLAGKDHRR